MKGYSFGELVKLAEAAMPKAGGTFTGNITAPAVFISGAQSTDSKAATRYDWVAAELRKKLDLAGGTLTGTLTGTKFLQTGAQGTEGNSLTRRDYVDTKVARYEYGVGSVQGQAPMADLVTEGKVRDFNKLLVAGEFTCDGSWENGINNIPDAQGHTGIVKVEVRRYGDGPAYVQTFKWAVGQTLGTKTRMGTGTYPNITWRRWVSSGTHELETESRMLINRPGAGVHPYMTMTKQDWREDIAANSAYAVGSLQYRVGPYTDQNPDSALMAGLIQVQVLGSNDYSTMLIASRDLGNNSSNAELRVGVIDSSNKRIGVSCKSAGKTTQIYGGTLSTDTVVLTAAQSSDAGAATRKDYVDGLAKKYLPLGGGELTGQLVVSHDDTTVVVRPRTAARACYIQGQNSVGANQWRVGDPDGSGTLSLQAKDSYLNVGAGGVVIGGNASITGPWYKSITSERHSGFQGLTTGNVERFAVFHDTTTKLLSLRSQGGTAVTINAEADLAARDLVSRVSSIGMLTAGYYPVQIREPQAGNYGSWQERTPAIQVSCPLAVSAAYSVWKATQPGRAHIASMDVHLPENNLPYVTLSMYGGSTQHQWAGNNYLAAGEIRTDNGGIFDRGHLVYSPINVPDLPASKGNYDVVVGNAGNVGAYMFMQNHPSLAFGARVPGEIAPGSHLRPCSCDNDWDDWVDWYVPAGNWRCQGYTNLGGPTAGGTEGDFTAGKTLWIRCN